MNEKPRRSFIIPDANDTNQTQQQQEQQQEEEVERPTVSRTSSVPLPPPPSIFSRLSETMTPTRVNSYFILSFFDLLDFLI